MDLYFILGVDSKATPEEIKKAYKNLSKIHHPDKGGSQEEFNKIKDAYNILSDPVRRKHYDTTGRVEAVFSFETEVKHVLLHILSTVESTYFSVVEVKDGKLVEPMSLKNVFLTQIRLMREDRLKVIDDCKVSYDKAKLILKYVKKGKDSDIFRNLLLKRAKDCMNLKKQAMNDLKVLESVWLILDSFEYDLSVAVLKDTVAQPHSPGSTWVSLGGIPVKGVPPKFLKSFHRP